MNCRPGDLARVVVPGRFYGALVSVIEAAPVGTSFRLPCGHLNLPCEAGDWVVEVLGSPVPVGLELGGTRLARFGATADANLKPIRDPGDDAVDETLIWAGDPRVREVQHG